MTAMTAFTDTLRLFLRAPLLFLTIGLVGHLIIYGVEFIVFGSVSVTITQTDHELDLAGASLPTIFLRVFLVYLALLQVLSAVLHLAAWDVIAGRRPAIGDHIKLSVRYLPYLVGLSIAVGFVVGIGGLLFVIPGLYVWSALSVVIPAVVIGQAGLGAWQRSWDITAEYRWTILGGLILVIIASSAITSVLLLLAAVAGLEIIASVLAGAVSLSLFAIFATHVYATLGGTASERP